MCRTLQGSWQQDVQLGKIPFSLVTLVLSIDHSRAIHMVNDIINAHLGMAVPTSHPILPHLAQSCILFWDQTARVCRHTTCAPYSSVLCAARLRVPAADPMAQTCPKTPMHSEGSEEHKSHLYLGSFCSELVCRFIVVLTNWLLLEETILFMEKQAFPEYLGCYILLPTNIAIVLGSYSCFSCVFSCFPFCYIFCWPGRLM